MKYYFKHVFIINMFSVSIKVLLTKEMMSGVAVLLQENIINGDYVAQRLVQTEGEEGLRPGPSRLWIS